MDNLILYSASFEKMRFISFFSGLWSAFLAASTVASPVSRADSGKVGYLISTFTDATPAVQFHLSNGNSASSFSFLNNGQPVLTSTVGTKAVRDIFLASNGAGTQWYLLATGEFYDSDASIPQDDSDCLFFHE